MFQEDKIACDTDDESYKRETRVYFQYWWFKRKIFVENVMFESILDTTGIFIRNLRTSEVCLFETIFKENQPFPNHNYSSLLM